MNKIKHQIYQLLLEKVDEKVLTAKSAIVSAKESRDNETKSSAGDKHETARAMAQIELENSEVHLSKVMELKKDLDQLDLLRISSKVEFGSLVETDDFNYFISIGLGRIQLEDQDYYCISKTSPMAKLLYDKVVGDEFHFQEKTIFVKDLA